MTEYPDLNEQIELIVNSKKRVNLPVLNIKPIEIVAIISREERLKDLYKLEPKEQDD